jgi:2-C-methyl-D-erythritol 4-phosphate cytidylyltransferase
VHLLIPAAGSGRRMGSDRNKLLLNVQGKSIFAWTLLAVEASQSIDWIGVVGQPHDFEDFRAIVDSLALSKPVVFIPGGKTRQESVYEGLKALPQAANQVLIHDGARCLATADLFDRCALSLGTVEGMIAAIAVKDTIKVVDSELLIQDTPDRSNLWAAQTPQGFRVDLLKQCHAEAVQRGWEVTDDAALFEKCGLPVKIVQGEETNLKVTTPVDMTIAAFILGDRSESDGHVSLNDRLS